MISSLPLGVAWATMSMGHQEPGPYLASSQSIGSSPGVQQHTPCFHLLLSSTAVSQWPAGLQRARPDRIPGHSWGPGNSGHSSSIPAPL